MDNLKDRNIAKYDKSLATLTTSAPLTLAESKLVFNIIAQIDLDDKDFKEYKINATELHNEIKNELNAEARKRAKLKGKVVTAKDIAKDKSSQLEIFCKNLRAKSLNLPVKNELDFDIAGWFDAFSYKSEEDIIYCQFNPKLKPYLLEFRNNHFKKIHTPNLFMFKSKYTHKFYLLLKTNHLDNTYITVDDYGSIIPIEWIRKWLGIADDEYKKYNDFKRFIIEKAIKDLKDFAEVYFEYEEVKTKLKVTHLKIKVKYKDRSLPNENEIDLTPTLFEEVDIVPKHMTISDFLAVPSQRNILIDGKTYNIKDIKIKNNKYVIETDREDLRQTHKNQKKLLTSLIKWHNSYKS